jgi:hypothetical protein
VIPIAIVLKSLKEESDGESFDEKLSGAAVAGGFFPHATDRPPKKAWQIYIELTFVKASLSLRLILTFFDSSSASICAIFCCNSFRFN